MGKEEWANTLRIANLQKKRGSGKTKRKSLGRQMVMETEDDKHCQEKFENKRKYDEKFPNTRDTTQHYSIIANAVILSDITNDILNILLCLIIL